MKRKNSPMPVCMWRWCECVCVFLRKRAVNDIVLRFHYCNFINQTSVKKTTRNILHSVQVHCVKSRYEFRWRRVYLHIIQVFSWEIRFLCLVLSLNVGRACSIASTWVRDQKWNDAICNITVTKVASLCRICSGCFSVKKVTVIKRWQNHRWLRVFYMLYEKCLLFKMFWWPQHHRPQR